MAGIIVGGIYELAGPEVLTPRDIAAAIGNRLGRTVRAEQISIESWRRQAEASEVDTELKP